MPLAKMVMLELLVHLDLLVHLEREASRDPLDPPGSRACPDPKVPSERPESPESRV